MADTVEHTSLFTVVVPVRNRAELVTRTLDSIAAQTFRPLTLVVVDNASTDGTADVLERWRALHQADDFRITLLSEPVAGPSNARNCGLRAVTTRYVMFFDSDDYMAPDHCGNVARELDANGYPDLMYWPLTYVDIAGRRRELAFSAGADVLAGHIFHTLLSTPRMVILTRLVNNVGAWNEALTGWEDYELGVRLLLGASSVVPVRFHDGVVAYAQASSVTGTDFSSTPARWEAALDECEAALSGAKKLRECRFIEVRRMILAGMYRREGALAHAMRLEGEVCGRTGSWSFRLLLRLVSWYVSHGGRGVAMFAKLLIR